MRKTLAIIALTLAAANASATVPHKFNVPDIPGYVTLKGDFHNHTIFSDGDIWPATRIEEAYYDDLDIISITDHNETRHRHMVDKGYFVAEKCTRDASYELADAAAKKYGILVVHGAELTRGSRLFPGHFNTHFITDGESLAKAAEAGDGTIKDKTKREEAGIINGLKEARKQGAFLVWNHPHWEKQAPNETKWWPIHEKIYKEGLMQGIEIENHLVGYSPEAFHWAMERDLTILSGTDSHHSMTAEVDYELGEHRSMTFVFAKERTLKGVREALDNHRTAVYTYDCVYGKEEFLLPLLAGIVEVQAVKFSKGKVTFALVNNSSIPVILTKTPGSEKLMYRREVRLNPGAEVSIAITPVGGASNFDEFEFDINFQVENFFTDADKNLQVRKHIIVPEKYRK